MAFRAMILRAAGTNCDYEAEAALLAAGAEVERVHVNRLLADPKQLDQFQLLLLPGGFTFGDDVASGAVMAYTLQQRLYEPLERFIDSGRYVLGICNGFQVLVRLGFLPGGAAAGRAALVQNLSAKFEDRWVRLKAGPCKGPWFEPGQEYFVPVAHAEGRFEWFPEKAGTPFPEAQICVSYIAKEGSETSYPENPNGSVQNIAGITNGLGNVMGLMPHPERFIQPTHHPNWTRYRKGKEHPTEQDLPHPLGLDLFRRLVEVL